MYRRYSLKPCLDGIQNYQKPCLDGILPSSVSNLRGDYHNPLPAKLVHTQKINHRRLVICWKTRWQLLGNYHVNSSHVQMVFYLRLLVIYEGIIIILYQRSLSTRKKINLRRLVICWKTRWQLLGNNHVNSSLVQTIAGKKINHRR